MPSAVSRRMRNSLGNDERAVHPHAFANGRHGGVRWAAVGEDLVFLVELIAGVGDAVRERAVVGQQQESFGFPIESPDRVDAVMGFHQIHDRATVALIACGGDIARWLVEHEIAQVRLLKLPAIDLDAVDGGVSFRAELAHDLAVDLDFTVEYELLGCASRRDPMGGENPLEPFH